MRQKEEVKIEEKTEVTDRFQIYGKTGGGGEKKNQITRERLNSNNVFSENKKKTIYLALYTLEKKWWCLNGKCLLLNTTFKVEEIGLTCLKKYLISDTG